MADERSQLTHDFARLLVTVQNELHMGRAPRGEYDRILARLNLPPNQDHTYDDIKQAIERKWDQGKIFTVIGMDDEQGQGNFEVRLEFNKNVDTNTALETMKGAIHGLVDTAIRWGEIIGIHPDELKTYLFNLDKAPEEGSRHDGNGSDRPAESGGGYQESPG
jgi:hypothetical protein